VFEGNLSIKERRTKLCKRPVFAGAHHKRLANSLIRHKTGGKKCFESQNKCSFLRLHFAGRQNGLLVSSPERAKVLKAFFI